MELILVSGFYGGKPAKMWLGTALRGDRKVFGYVHEGRMTQMCYGLDYYQPAELLATVRKRQQEEPTNQAWQYFYFDMGTTGTEVRVHYTEMTRAFVELGMLDRTNPHWYESHIVPTMIKTNANKVPVQLTRNAPLGTTFVDDTGTRVTAHSLASNYINNDPVDHSHRIDREPILSEAEAREILKKIARDYPHLFPAVRLEDACPNCGEADCFGGRCQH
jgi:hypothetical protein